MDTAPRSSARVPALLLLLTVAALLPGCGGGGGGGGYSGGGGSPSSYSVGGSISGLLTGNTVVLQDNGADNQTVNANGTVTFPTAIASGSRYAVTVLTQPTGQTCSVSNGNGTIASANITNITVTCTANTYTIAATVTGLPAGSSLVLQDNGSDNLSVSADGKYSFNTSIASQSSYAVTILTQPSNGTCTVTSGSGKVTGASVQVIITCATVASLSVFAGNGGGAGNVDGTGAAARFQGPMGLATDSAGNVYVADSLNQTIRKVTPTGVVTTFAGKAGGIGSSDGTGSAARFWLPHSVAIDGAGNLYVTDSGNATIRKITPAGVVSTLAGTPGARGYVDGTGPAAQFFNPLGIATDSSGNVYVTDVLAIRKITPSGVVSTFAGNGDGGYADGTGTGASFEFPEGVASDSADNLYVADTQNNIIRKITPAAVVTTIAGTHGVTGSSDGIGPAAQFNSPHAVTVDGAGNVYVADTYNYTIRQITPVGVVTTLAGTAGSSGSVDGTGAAARFDPSYGLVADNKGDLYVSDLSDAIRKIAAGAVVTTLAGTVGAYGTVDGTGAAAHFDGPQGLVADSSGNLYETESNLVRKITPAGVVTVVAGTLGPGNIDGTGSAVGFNGPIGLATDSAGNVYVADTGNNSIRKITPAGVVSTIVNSRLVLLHNPMGVAIDSAGNLYVADTDYNTIVKITPANVVSTLAGSSVSGAADGTGAAAEFSNPHGLAIDGAGNLYVADSGNNTIRKVTPAGVVTTIAGAAPSLGSADGLGAAARFSYPTALTLDGSGNLYVADSNNYTIRKITPDGTVTTVAGVAGQAGFVPGPLPGLLSNVFGVACSGGSLFVTLPAGIAQVSDPP